MITSMIFLFFSGTKSLHEKNLLYIFDLISHLKCPAIDYLFPSSPVLAVFKHTWFSNSIFSKMKLRTKRCHPTFSTYFLI